MPSFELAYPDEVSPSITYAPSLQPVLPDTREGPLTGIALEMVADGSTRAKRMHGSVGLHTRGFTQLTGTDKTNREAFFEAVNGIRSFRFRDGITSSWVWVKFDGPSLEPGAWSEVGIDRWARLEQFVEVPVPSVDALGAIRTGSLTISNLDLYADEAFSAAFSDNTWTMNLPSVYRTSGAPAPNYWLEYYNGGGSKSATGFRLRVSAPPGTGEAYTFEYLAVGS